MLVGRKQKYTTHIEPNFEVILGWLRSGYTEESIARRLGVAASTWRSYKIQFPAFLAVIKKGALDATALVVNALHKRATGYEYDEVQVTFSGPQQGQQGQQASQQRLIRKTTKHVPPDVGSIVFWLTNRDPNNWKNTQNIKHSGEIKGTGVLLCEPPKTTEGWLALHGESEKYQQLLESEHKNKLTKSNILEAVK